MGRNKAVALCVALVFGSVFAVAVSSWEKPAGIPKDAPPADRQPEFLAEQPRGEEPEVTHASFEKPESYPAAIGVPALLPTLPAEPMPAEVASEEPAAAEPTPENEPAAEEKLAEEQPAEKAPAADPAEPTPASEDEALAPAPESGSLAWYTDYGQAMEAAIEQQRMLFIFFFDPQKPDAHRAFEEQSLADPRNREVLARDYVAARLPIDTTITSGGKPTELLKHPAYAEMLGRSGVAVLDFAHPEAEYFGRVVSTFPFVSGRYYSKPVLSTVLTLPPGTLTQRTMIYAVRIHPEAPASTQGQFNGVLADEANRHSTHQAAILVQGHHNWESRFHRINARLSSGVLAEEVVAESWPSENLVDACVDCVDSWRHSPGHWQAVRTRHPLFGFDIQRGRNGIWYATGIFGHR
jgi:hypothetical protein